MVRVQATVDAGKQPAMRPHSARGRSRSRLGNSFGSSAIDAERLSTITNRTLPVRALPGWIWPSWLSDISRPLRTRNSVTNTVMNGSKNQGKRRDTARGPYTRRRRIARTSSLCPQPANPFDDGRVRIVEGRVERVRVQVREVVAGELEQGARELAGLTGEVARELVGLALVLPRPARGQRRHEERSEERR